MKALLIDTNPEMQGTLNLAFRFSWPNLELLSAGQGARAIEIAEREMPQMIFVDDLLSDMEAPEVVRHIRQFSDIPIIIFGQSNDETHVAKGLESGADDYILKPIRVLELLARTRAVMRRSAGFAPETSCLPSFVSSHLVIDYATREVLVEGRPVHLTPTEYKLLCILARNAGCVATMHMLKQQVWQNDEYVDSNTVRKCICQLRHKLNSNSSNGEIILNERGVGYRIAKFNKLREPENTDADNGLSRVSSLWGSSAEQTPAQAKQDTLVLV